MATTRYLLVVDDEGAARLANVDDDGDGTLDAAATRLPEASPMPLGLALLAIARNAPGWMDRPSPRS